jgi:hypothetical protein
MRRSTCGGADIQIDRLLGEFAGGRWVFANFNGTIEAGYHARLRKEHRRRTRFEVRTDFVVLQARRDLPV